MKKIYQKATLTSSFVEPLGDGRNMFVKVLIENNSGNSGSRVYQEIHNLSAHITSELLGLAKDTSSYRAKDEIEEFYGDVVVTTDNIMVDGKTKIGATATVSVCYRKSQTDEDHPNKYYYFTIKTSFDPRREYSIENGDNVDEKTNIEIAFKDFQENDITVTVVHEPKLCGEIKQIVRKAPIAILTVLMFYEEKKP